MFAEGLLESESLIFVILCVLCFQRQSFLTFLLCYLPHDSNRYVDYCRIFRQESGPGLFVSDATCPP